MKRIKEDEIKEILESFNHKNLIMQTEGIFMQKCFYKHAEIVFLKDNVEFQIKDNNNCIVFNLCYIDEIILLEKNKLKFLINQELEILIFIK